MNDKERMALLDLVCEEKELRKANYTGIKAKVLEIVRDELGWVRGLLAKGKGTWPESNYIRDLTWAEWRAEERILRRLETRLDTEIKGE